MTNAALWAAGLIAAIPVGTFAQAATEDPERKRILLTHAERLAKAASEQLKLTSDREAVWRRYEQTLECTNKRPYHASAHDYRR